MGRPIKQGADWFKHDKDMRADDKVLALRRKYGVEGYGIWCMMLEKLTDSDDFSIELSPAKTELLAGDFGFHPLKLAEIIDYFLQLDLLQKEILAGDNAFILTSRRLKQRFEVVLANRNSDRESFRRRKYTEKSRVEKSNGNGDPLRGSPISLRPASLESPSSVIPESQFQVLKASMPWNNPSPAPSPQPPLPNLIQIPISLLSLRMN